MNKHVRSLWTRIMLSMTLLVVLAVAALGISSGLTSYRDAVKSIDNLNESTCKAHAIALEEYLDMLMLSTSSLAESGAVTSNKLSFEERQENIKRVFALRDDIVSLYTVNSSGIGVNDAAQEDVGENYAGESFFISGMAHRGGYIDLPCYDEWNDMVTMTVSYKLTNADGFSGIVCVDVIFDTVRELVTGGALGETGYSFLTDQDGIIRSHPDEKLVIDEMSYAEFFGEDSEVTKVLTSMFEVDAGKSDTLHIDGENVRLYSKKIPLTGWNYVSVIKVDEFMGNYRNQLMFTAIIALICIMVAMLLAFVISRRIAHPISVMRRRMDLLAAGDLHSPLPESRQNDEVGVLYHSMEASLRSLSAYMTDISENMKSLAEGDLRTTAVGHGAYAYTGDFLPISESMENLRASLRGFFSNTGNAAKSIAATSAQMANASSELSKSTVEQAAAIDRIDKSFEGIKNSLVSTSASASDTLAKTYTTRDELERSSEDMEQMMSAMREIEATSRSVAKIIKEIDDIAYTAGILSLNAAIEGARAGVHGKGFSVVADEVRNLAGKSVESAQDTEELIKGSITAVEKGMGIAEATWEKIDRVCLLLGSVAELIESIEATVTQQAAAANDIYADLSNLNMIVQNDTAMSEETTSASVELSHRMGLLYRELEFFRTDDEN